jgi:hypothetical protein
MSHGEGRREGNSVTCRIGPLQSGASFMPVFDPCFGLRVLAHLGSLADRTDGRWYALRRAKNGCSGYEHRRSGGHDSFCRLWPDTAVYLQFCRTPGAVQHLPHLRDFA